MESQIVLRNHREMAVLLVMNVGGFFKTQTKMTDTYKYNGYFFASRGSQGITNILKEKHLSVGLNCK